MPDVPSSVVEGHPEWSLDSRGPVVQEVGHGREALQMFQTLLDDNDDPRRRLHPESRPILFDLRTTTSTTTTATMTTTTARITTSTTTTTTTTTASTPTTTFHFSTWIYERIPTSEKRSCYLLFRKSFKTFSTIVHSMEIFYLLLFLHIL